MTSTDPGDLYSVTQLNEHDILRPFMFSPGTSREAWDHRADFYEARDKFMGVNPEMVAMCGLIADEMILLREGRAELCRDEIELPEAVSPHGGSSSIMFFNSESPYFGIRLTLDQQVKLQTDDEQFVHAVNSMFYDLPDGLGYEASFLLGVVDRTDPRGEDEFSPPFALAISQDCRYARFVPRVSDEEVARRREASAIEKLAIVARIAGKEQLRDHAKQLRQEALVNVRAGLRDPRISRIANLALVTLLGEDEMVALAATDSETHMFGLDQYGDDELMIVESIDDIPTEDLLAAQALLDRSEAYDYS